MTSSLPRSSRRGELNQIAKLFVTWGMETCADLFRTVRGLLVAVDYYICGLVFQSMRAKNPGRTKAIEDCKLQIAKCKLQNERKSRHTSASVQFAICNLQSPICNYLLRSARLARVGKPQYSALYQTQLRDSPIGQPFHNVDVSVAVPGCAMRAAERAGDGLVLLYAVVGALVDVWIVSELNDHVVVVVENGDAARAGRGSVFPTRAG